MLQIRYNFYGDIMYSIDKKTTSLIEINKSKFYGILIPINSIEEVNKIINLTKSEYKDATHYCYAYILDNTKRFNDDGEPGGTAGMPILNVLETNNLNHVLAIVVRYFGGIKLGAGGLVRAYTNSITTTLNNSSIIELIKGYRLKIIFEYNNSKQIDYILKSYNIVDKTYDKNIEYIIEIPYDDDIKDMLNNYIISYEIIDNIYIKK